MKELILKQRHRLTCKLKEQAEHVWSVWLQTCDGWAMSDCNFPAMRAHKVQTTTILNSQSYICCYDKSSQFVRWQGTRIPKSSHWALILEHPKLYGGYNQPSIREHAASGGRLRLKFSHGGKWETPNLVNPPGGHLDEANNGDGGSNFWRHPRRTYPGPRMERPVLLKAGINLVWQS